MDKTGLSAKDVKERIARNERELAAKQAEIRNKVAALSAEKIDAVSQCLSAAAEAPVEGLAAALQELQIGVEIILKDGASGDEGAAEWLLRDGVAQLGRVLRRPELGAAAAPEAARHVAWLCHWLLVAARNEAQEAAQLHRVIEHLRPAAPACLRVLNLWLDSSELTGDREAKVLALAVTTAELAEAAVGGGGGGGLPGGKAQLARFMAGCRRRLQAAAVSEQPLGREAAQPTAAAPANPPPGFGSGTDAAGPAATAAAGCPVAAAGAAAGWDTALGLAAVAFADMAHNPASAEAISAPLRFGPEHLDQQQQHLLHIGSVLETVTVNFAMASGRAAAADPAAASPHGGGRGGGPGFNTAAIGQGQLRPPALLLLPQRLQQVTDTVLFVVPALGRRDPEELAAWPAWQPWSEAIASCLERLPLLGGGGCMATAQAAFEARMRLLSAARQVLQVAMPRGVAALQRPPLPALLAAMSSACAFRPAALGLGPQHLASVRADMAFTAGEALAAVVAALAAPAPAPPPPPSPQLLRAACPAISGLLTMAPGGSLWQRGAGQQGTQGAEAAHTGPSPGGPLKWLANLTTQLLRGGPPTVVAELRASSTAQALVAALAPPHPPAGGNQRQRQQQRLAAGAVDTIWAVCIALQALLRDNAHAQKAVAAGGSSWAAVAAAIRQALPLVGAVGQSLIEVSLRHVDCALERQQEPASGGADAEAARASPGRRRGGQKQQAAGAVPRRTTESADAAMRALLLEEEEAAAIARRKASPKKPKGKPSAAVASSSAAPANGGSGGPATSPSAAAEAGAAAAAGAAAEAEVAGPTPSQSTQQWMLCPITQEVMRDPVLCEADGQTYERAAITAWLQQHGTSFVSKAPAQSQNLIPNHMLRSIIQAAGP